MTDRTKDTIGGLLRNLVAPFVAVVLALVTLGGLPKCGEIQTKAEAKEAHEKAETARTAILIEHEKDIDRLREDDAEIRRLIDQKLDVILTELRRPRR